jgi:hypothetical protein
LERSLILAAGLLLLGTMLGVAAFTSWGADAYGRLDPVQTMRLVIPSATAILLGFQIAFGGFFVNVLETRGSAIPTPAPRPRSSV